MKRTVFYKAALIIGLLMAFGHGTAHAAAITGGKILTITPATVKPVIDPGTIYKGSFQIINQGQSDYPVHVYAAPYSVQGEDYNPDFTPLPGKPDTTSWLQFNVTRSTVKQGQALPVNYTVTIPADTQPGGYYVVAFVETQAQQAHQGVIVNERVGEIFYITVAGPVKQSGKLLDWKAPILQKMPLTATIRLENDGGVHYASDIHVVVQDIFGNPKYSLGTQKEVLPQTIRRVTTSWAGAPPLGLFKVTGSASVLGKTQTLPTKYVLVASPLIRTIFLTIVGVIVLFAVARFVLRKRIKRKKASKKPKKSKIHDTDDNHETPA